jgi:hypothetical protein
VIGYFLEMSSMKEVEKTAVSVSEMARNVGLSRARFYQLIGEGVFPKPEYEPSTKRPFYNEDSQKVCFQVKRRNVGINGKVVIFYAARRSFVPQVKRQAVPKPKQKCTPEFVDLIDSLACLGVSATSQQVEVAVKQCFPDGVQAQASGEVVRAVFLFLKRQAPSA